MADNNQVSDEDIEITELIQSGQYYKDALNWYNQLYLHPFNERSIAFILMMVIILAAAPVFYSFNGLYPLVDRIPFVIWSRNTDEYYPELKKLSDDLVNAEAVLAQHFLTNYVKDREEYSPLNQEVNELSISRIKHSSSRRVLWQYEEEQDPSNPNSYFMKYGYHTARKIDWMAMQFPEGQNKLGRAYARFQVSEKNKNGTKTSIWDANITFRFTDLTLVLKERKPLQLSVTSYEKKQVQ